MPPTKKKAKKAATPKDKGTVDKEAADFIASLRKAGQLGDVTKELEFVSTGSWVLNRLIGDGTHQDKPGGVPKGYVTEIFGDEGCGKTTVALHIAKQAQLAGEKVLYADFEKALRAQRQYVKNLGIDTSPEKFLHVEPDSLEDGAKIIGHSLAHYKPSVIIVDSVAAMLPKSTFEKDADETTQIGLHAKLVGTFLNWICKRLTKANCALVLVNQLRSNIKTSQYDPGPNEMTTGGRALRYYSTIRLHLKNTGKKEQISSQSNITGVSEKKAVNQVVKAVIIKNKIDMPFKSGPIYIAFGQGIDNVLSLVDLAVNRKVIKKSGGWFEWNDPNSDMSFKIQGQYNVKKHLEDHPEILDTIKPYIMPTRDDQELDEIYKTLEAKENLTDDELEQLNQIRKLKGMAPVGEEDISKEDQAALNELDELMDS